MTIEAGLRPEATKHAVLFYDDDSELIDGVCDYLVQGLHNTRVAVVIATPEHASAFRDGLTATGLDVASAEEKSELLMLDAATTLKRFMIGGRPDPTAFNAVLGDMIRAARRGGHRPLAYGEMVALLWDEGNVSGALELEQLWNDLLAEQDFSLFCAYPSRILAGSDGEALQGVCDLHTDVFGRTALTETWTFPCDINSPRKARRVVADLLDRWGFTSAVDDAITITGELAANAVRHAQTSFLLALSAHGNTVRISVEDGSPAEPKMGRISLVPSASRGMILIDAIAARWGTEHVGSGKSVWAELKPT